MIVQAPPEAERTTAATHPTQPTAPGVGGYTNVGYVGQQNREPEITYQPDSENVNFRF